MIRIARSIIVGIVIWCCFGWGSVYALASEMDSVTSLSDDRWEWRDPFLPLIDFTQEIQGKSVNEVTTMTGNEEWYRYRAEGRRDPFLSVLDVGQGPVRRDGPLTPLEQFEPSQLRLVGVIWNSDGYRALLETPDGMAYTADLGTAIGVNGTVSNISEENLIVRQSVQDIFGGEKTLEVELTLYPSEEAVTLPSSSILHEN